jgi:hypothetical protein
MGGDLEHIASMIRGLGRGSVEVNVVSGQVQTRNGGMPSSRNGKQRQASTFISIDSVKM